MAASLAGDAFLAAPDRSQVDLVFIDAVDGKPPVGEFPRPLDLSYRLVAAFRAKPAAKDDPLLDLAIELPATTPPTQVPRLISAGMALSPYVHSDDYSSTDPRRRMIWLEFDRATDDPEDTYFARVLRAAPDPLLLGPGDDTVPEEPVDPALPVDPEWTRVIVPGQSDDRAGIAAMQRLLAGDSPTHFLLPLPPGVHEGDPELLGFYTYEFRVGHDQQWSTAQGRFGAALRVAGLQHAAPTLTCSVRRLSTGIIASAPYADPVFQGVSVRPHASPGDADLDPALCAGPSGRRDRVAKRLAGEEAGPASRSRRRTAVPSLTLRRHRLERVRGGVAADDDWAWIRRADLLPGGGSIARRRARG